MTIRGGALLWSALGAALFAPGAAAQQSTLLRGQVRLGGEPLSGHEVTVHRVAPDTAGELADLQTDASGRFSFDLPGFADPPTGEEVFFASARYDGILYFGPAISDAVDLDSLYVIDVYPTMGAADGGESFALELRNLFLESQGEGWRVTDLFQIRNDAEFTVVGSAALPVWIHVLPPGATDFELGQGDIPPDAVDFSDGTLRISAPVPPGNRLFVVRYRLPDVGFVIPVSHPADRIELLVQEPAADLTVEGLSPAPPVEIQPGVTYRRYAADGVSVDEIRVVQAESDGPGGLSLEVLLVGLALALGALGIWVVGRHPARVPVTGPEGGDARGRLLLEIARLDEEFHAGGAERTDAETRAYEERRSLLRAQLDARP